MSGRSTLRRSREIKYVFDRKSPQPESRPSSSHYTRSQNLAPVPTTTDRLIGAFADDVTTDGGYEDNEEEDAPHPSTSRLPGVPHTASSRSQVDEMGMLTPNTSSHNPGGRFLSSTVPHAYHRASGHSANLDFNTFSQPPRERYSLNMFDDQGQGPSGPLNLADSSRRRWVVSDESHSTVQRNRSASAELVYPAPLMQDKPLPPIHRSATTVRSRMRRDSDRPSSRDFRVVGVEYYATDPSSSGGIRQLPPRPARSPRTAKVHIEHSEIGLEAHQRRRIPRN